MTRQDFLKGMVALMAVPFMPEIKAEAKPVFDVKRIQARIDYLQKHPSKIRKYPLTYEECLSPKEVLEIYNETGLLLYSNVRIVE